MKTVERGHGRLTVSATAGSIGLAVLLGVLAVPAGAALGAAPWSDYANYPSALPAGCADGPAALAGVLFNNGWVIPLHAC